ncbi:MAG: hypothetical protein JSS32_01070 [Verrucomicrobia bacterium]|nr:hypothetical protein [Verrucomicrobiota bacterium]
MKKLRQEFADTMLEVGPGEPRLVVMVGDISHGILQSYAKACPGRYFNIGICEPTIVNMAAGVAKSGLIPVVHTIAPFIIERAYEQIKLDFGYQRLGLNLISVGSAFDYAQLGCSHHCYTDISLISHFKNSHIFFPASPIEFNLLFKGAYNNGCINYFRLPEVPHGVVFGPEEIQQNKAIKVLDGDDLTIVAIGPQLKAALEASHLLKNVGITPEILYYPVIKPFDHAAVLNSVQKTGKVLVIEEASAHDGVFNRVVHAVKHLPAVEYSQIAISDFVHQYGTYEELCADLGFSAKGILNKVKQDFKFEVKKFEHASV